MNVHKTAAEIQAELASRFKKRRLSLNLTQNDVASRTNVSRSAVQNLEEKGNATVQTLVSVGKVLGVDLSEAVPLPPDVSPIDVFHETKPRVRASSRRQS